MSQAIVIVPREPGVVYQTVVELAESWDYKVTSLPNNTIKLVRGSTGLTIAFGALAGKGFYMELLVTVQQTGPEQTQVTLTRNVAGGALMGGALGASKAKKNYEDLAQALRETFGVSGQPQQLG